MGNNTAYGLGSSVWSDSLPKALEVAITLKAGAVWVNCHNQFDAAAGFGGYKVKILKLILSNKLAQFYSLKSLFY